MRKLFIFIAIAVIGISTGTFVLHAQTVPDAEFSDCVQSWLESEEAFGDYLKGVRNPEINKAVDLCENPPEETGNDSLCVEYEEPLIGSEDTYRAMACCSGYINECEEILNREYPGLKHWWANDRDSCIFTSGWERREGQEWDGNEGVCRSSTFEITYPIRELDNCASQQECKAYCDTESNYSKCSDFAQKNNLTELVPAVYTAMQNGEGPGGCNGETSCRAYCEDVDHLEACVSFIEKFNLASADDLKEIYQVVDAKKSGIAFPGNCKTKASCMKYCEGPAHVVECMEFGLKTGLIPKEDLEGVNKILPYLKSGGKMPGGCTTKESCDAYCADDAHINECMDFAVGAGFMTKEEAEIMKKTGGKGPGNCKSREACDNYCKDEAHIDECIDFAVKAGFISQEDAEMAKKFKITSGPGGCKGKAECESFCVTNQDVCIKWGKEHGIDMGGGQGGPGNAEECAKFGGTWTEQKCELGASECVKQGGTWGPDKETGEETCNFSGGMGQDNRKEFEACLGKATCAEFNSCFVAIPNQSNQQSSGQGQQQGPQDETGKKIQARAMACLDEKMDACLVLSCSEFAACTKSLQQGSPEQGTGDQGPGQSQENPKFNAKMIACQEEIKAIQMKEIQAKQTACLSRSCSEFESCLKALQSSGGDQGGQQGDQQGQGTPDPAMDAKIKTCQQEKTSACLAKPCSEFQACLNSLGGGGQQSGEQQQGTPDPAVNAKFMTCFPPPPQGGGGPPSSLLEHSFLGAISRFLLK